SARVPDRIRVDQQHGYGCIPTHVRLPIVSRPGDVTRAGPVLQQPDLALVGGTAEQRPEPSSGEN
ncbi:TPA: hypothetical protein O2751_002746, partial [Staphylococcus aureus]|nr:hypothetical protein [Staphylococcus aureus]